MLENILYCERLQEFILLWGFCLVLFFFFQRLGGDMVVSYKCVLAKLSVKLVSSVI